jgi:hypothetical protein
MCKRKLAVPQRQGQPEEKPVRPSARGLSPGAVGIQWRGGREGGGVLGVLCATRPEGNVSPDTTRRAAGVPCLAYMRGAHIPAESTHVDVWVPRLEPFSLTQTIKA